METKCVFKHFACKDLGLKQWLKHLGTSQKRVSY